MKLEVVLVSTDCYQKYIEKNIEQLLKFDFNISVITDKKFFKNLEKYKDIKKISTEELDVNLFDKNTKLNKNFRNGFWNNCSKRIFLLYEYMKKFNIGNVIHLENDVLLYTDMNYKFDDKIYLTMDSKNRCIPGIMYISRYQLYFYIKLLVTDPSSGMRKVFQVEFIYPNNNRNKSKLTNA